MSTPSDDGPDSELNKYAPKWSREQPATPDAERPRYVSTSASTASFAQRGISGPADKVFKAGTRPGATCMAGGWVTGADGPFVTVAAFAALVALLVIFGKPLLQRVGVLERNSPSTQVSKPADRLAANDAPANRALVPAAGMAAAPGAVPSATAQAQQVPLSRRRAASGTLSDLESARAREQRQQCRSRGNGQRNSVWDFRTIHWSGQGTRPEYEAGY